MVNLRAKCVICGDSAVGKTALIQSFHSDGTQFPKNYLMTTGVELHVKTVPIPDTTDTVELFLYDCAGKDIFLDQVIKHLDDAAMLLVVYDVTCEESFSNCSNWIKNIQNANPENPVPSVLVANKTDLQERRMVSSKAGEEFSKSQNMDYFECSAKELKGIETPFLHLAICFHAAYNEKVSALNQQSQ